MCQEVCPLLIGNYLHVYFTVNLKFTNIATEEFQLNKIINVTKILFFNYSRSSISMSSSLSDLVGSPSLDLSSDTVLTIEDIRAQMGQCFTCGVSWTDDHVSLDCSECGGYSMERPCPMCDGSCGQVWKRDFTLVS